MTDRDQARSSPAATDWNAILARALEGDGAAYARLTRLVVGYLDRWRAYDFRPDWDDIVQEVLVSTVTAYREGRRDPPGALAAYVRQATRFKFIDRIRAHKRIAADRDPQDSIERGEAAASWPPMARDAEGAPSAESRATLARLLEHLPDREREAVYEVYVRGRTYDEAAEATGIPLGSLKRALRSGLATLRRGMVDARD